MRDLYKNMTSLWYVSPTEYTDVVDTDGFYTGEQEVTFADPIEIRMSLYPSNGLVAERIFGKEASLDMIACSTIVSLDEEGLLFLDEPVADYSDTYDYRISTIRKSLNSHYYGLNRRV